MDGLLDDSVVERAARRNGDERPIGGLPKIKDIIRRNRRDSDPQMEAPDLDFEYQDTDTLPHEIAELYSYSESPEFYQNRVKFLEQLEKKFPGAKWPTLQLSQKKADLTTLLDQLEVVNATERMDAARSILYLAHGNYSIGMKEFELLQISRKNLFLMLECGVFQAITQLLCLEMENLERAMEAMHKGSISLIDNVEVRVCLSILYIFIENLRREDPSDTEGEKKLREEFIRDLSRPIIDDDSLAAILFMMLLKFCSGNMPHYPIKKILLLIWKIILTTLGGTKKLTGWKKQLRVEAGLPAEYKNPKSGKAISLSNPAFDPPTTIERKSRDELIFALQKDSSASASTPSESTSGVIRPKVNTKGLEFRPKVRIQDVEAFIENSRAKFSCFESADMGANDLAGLPDPIKESIEVLRAHVYTPLSDIQIKEEEQLESRLAGKPLEEVTLPERSSEAENFYKILLPNLPQYMIALLKILLAAAPTSKARSDSLNILVDVMPQEIPSSIIESTQLTLDINRHKEIIVKAISAILLLLLKHFKVNHIYQFEFMSQHLVFANCIQLILKFFNQNTIQLLQYVTAKNNISATDFTNCVLRSALEEESNESVTPDPGYCWRNIFSCINLVRILQKLTKWKHSRTMMLVVFKSAPILKRALKVRHPMMQLYVLKLLKVQAKYLGRNWRRSNMKIISSIYQMVRHRLHDDWAYGNDLDARPWDFQTEEYALRACVDRFNARYYNTDLSVVSQNEDELIKVDMTPVDVNPLSVLGEEVELSDEWKEHYEEWVDKEVIFNPPNWDHVLNHP